MGTTKEKPYFDCKGSLNTLIMSNFFTEWFKIMWGKIQDIAVIKALINTCPKKLTFPVCRSVYVFIK